MAGVGIEHDNYLGCLLVHAVVFAKGVHHPFPEGFGIAGVYAVTKEDDGFEIVKGDVDVLTFFILHLALHRNVVFTKHAGLEDGTEVVAHRLEMYVEKAGNFMLEHPYGSVYYFDFDNGFADFFLCDFNISSFHNDFVWGDKYTDLIILPCYKRSLHYLIFRPNLPYHYLSCYLLYVHRFALFGYLYGPTFY